MIQQTSTAGALVKKNKGDEDEDEGVGLLAVSPTRANVGRTTAEANDLSEEIRVVETMK